MIRSLFFTTIALNEPSNDCFKGVTKKVTWWCVCVFVIVCNLSMCGVCQMKNTIEPIRNFATVMNPNEDFQKSNVVFFEIKRERERKSA